MSLFKVCIETIGWVGPHPNADRLDLAKVTGLAFQFCIGKDEYKVGDRVLYIPIDSVLPDNIIEKLNIRNFLAGAKKNRIKTVQLRGQISQGLVCKPGAVDLEGDLIPGEDLAPTLGITKYEPPEIFQAGARLLPLPDGLGRYDIEGADRFMNIIELLMDQPVYITEKLEGSNESILNADPEPVVCQHGNLILLDDPTQPNSYVDTARNQGLFTMVREIQVKVDEGSTAALRGELLGPGIQKNIYALKKHEIRMFDVKIGHQYLDAETFEAAIPENQRVPVISKGKTLREWLAGRTVQEASNGMSLLNPKIRREGIVIKPMVEQCVDFGDGHLQRLIIKQRSPEYLAKESD